MRSCWHTPPVTVAHTALPDLDLLDATGLKALILVQHEQLLSHRSEIEHLKLLIAKLRRLQFGRKSEKLERQIEQLELKLEELEENRPPARLQSEPPPSPSPTFLPTTQPSRRALPAHLPRQIKTHEPKPTSCPECGGRLKKLG